MRYVALPFVCSLVLSVQGQLGPEHRFVYPTAPGPVAMHDVDGDGDGDLLRMINMRLMLFEQDPQGAVSMTNDLGLIGTVDRIRFADLDGDGIGDIVLPRRTAGNVAWIRVLGGGSYAPTEDLVTGLGMVYDAQPADLDDDGDIDLVAAYTNPQAIGWAENLGGGVFNPPAVLVSGSFSVTNSISVFTIGDIDLDGDPDLATFLSGLQWLENDGAGGFTAHPITGSNDIHDIALGDVYGDSSPDLLIARIDFNEGVYLRVNDGTGTFAAEQLTASAGEGRIYNMHLADQEFDGDLDLFAWWSSGNCCVGDHTQCLVNNGNGYFLEGTSYAWSDAMQPFAVGDWDGDTIVDVAAFSNGSLRVGSQSIFSDQNLPVTSVQTPECIIALDTDQDGDQDVVLSGPTFFGTTLEGSWPLQIAVHQNAGGGTMVQCPHEIHRSDYAIERAQPADLDGDGDEDLLTVRIESFSGTSRELFWFRNQGAGQWDTVGSIGSDFFQMLPDDPLVPVIRDLDLDDDLDIVRHMFFQTEVLLNQGAGVFASPITVQLAQPGVTNSPRAVTLCDVDHDGDPDYVWGRADSLFWNANDGLGNPGGETLLGTGLITFEPSSGGVHNAMIHSADLNMDSYEDLILFNGVELAVTLNAQNSNFLPAQAFSVAAVAYDIGDMDMNGYPDIVALKANGEVFYLPNDGNGVMAGPFMLATPPASTGTSDLHLADMDGDADLDVLTCSASGSAAWLENEGLLPTATPTPTTLGSALVFPNPMSESARVIFSTPLDPTARIELVDVNGRVVRTVNGNWKHEVTLQRGDLPSGIYTLRVLETGLATIARLVVE